MSFPRDPRSLDRAKFLARRALAQIDTLDIHDVYAGERISDYDTKDIAALLVIFETVIDQYRLPA